MSQQYLEFTKDGLVITDEAGEIVPVRDHRGLTINTCRFCSRTFSTSRDDCPYCGANRGPAIPAPPIPADETKVARFHVPVSWFFDRRRVIPLPEGTRVLGMGPMDWYYLGLLVFHPAFRSLERFEVLPLVHLALHETQPGGQLAQTQWEYVDDP